MIYEYHKWYISDKKSHVNNFSFKNLKCKCITNEIIKIIWYTNITCVWIFMHRDFFQYAFIKSETAKYIISLQFKTCRKH